MKETLVRLGTLFNELVASVHGKNGTRPEFENLLLRSHQKNPWFTQEQVLFAFESWAGALKKNKIEEWLEPYRQSLQNQKRELTVGVVNAGNIPLVGLHDMLCVLVSGHRYIGKNSSDDPFLLPYVSELIFHITPSFQERISFVEKLSGMDAVIATGSNNSARYFEYYFGKYPHIIRMNRNAVAVLTGNETESELKNLGKDIFQYHGLGCRNVSKIFVPRDYEFDKLFGTLESFSVVAQHHKYMNNFEYNNAIYLLKRIPFLTNNFLILKEDDSIASPVSVLYYERYDEMEALKKKLQGESEKIQCIASHVAGEKFIPFGQTQHPELWDYADGVDTLNFLLQL
ncbi:MAG: acyl-CoA reductase [Bacteroidetes bacterium]|nr:acyl-CoA reductase [Bacteroidota bacterium]